MPVRTYTQNRPLNMGLGTEKDIPNLIRSFYQLWDKLNNHIKNTTQDIYDINKKIDIKNNSDIIGGHYRWVVENGDFVAQYSLDGIKSWKTVFIAVVGDPDMVDGTYRWKNENNNLVAQWSINGEDPWTTVFTAVSNPELE